MNSTTNDPIDTIEYGYCHCGCGEKTRLAPQTDRQKGWIGGEPVRFVKGHNIRGSNNPYCRPLEERFWEKVNRDGPGGCWIWTGSTNGRYGQVCLNGVPKKAHRISWEMKNGPIPDGLHCLHRCDRPECCNPSHLFIGTQADNIADMIKKGRAWYQRD